MSTSLEVFAILTGRVLYAGLFILAGVNHFRHHAEMVAQGRALRMPIPELALPATSVVLLLGGMSVLLGVWVHAGTLLLAGFLVASAVMVHRFWGLPDAQVAQQQLVHFSKNLALAGAALLIGTLGTGPLSLHP